MAIWLRYVMVGTREALASVATTILWMNPRASRHARSLCYVRLGSLRVPEFATSLPPDLPERRENTATGAGSSTTVLGFQADREGF